MNNHYNSKKEEINSFSLLNSFRDGINSVYNKRRERFARPFLPKNPVLSSEKKAVKQKSNQENQVDKNKSIPEIKSTKIPSLLNLVSTKIFTPILDFDASHLSSLEKEITKMKLSYFKFKNGNLGEIEKKVENTNLKVQQKYQIGKETIICEVPFDSLTEIISSNIKNPVDKKKIKNLRKRIKNISDNLDFIKTRNNYSKNKI